MKTLLAKWSGAVAIAAGIAGLALAAPPSNLDGRWDATLVTGGVTVPFRLDISGNGDHIVGTLYNGEETEVTTSASVHDGNVELNFDHYLTSIRAVVKDGELDGQVVSTRRGGSINTQSADKPDAYKPGADRPAPEGFGRGGSAFHAVRYVALTSAEAANVPSIDGVWEIPHESPKGEKAWRLIVQQHGADITTTILRVDGDTGALVGSWKDGKFVASHFDGARPGLIVLTPQQDGTLQVDLNAGQRTGVMTAYRPEVAREKGLPEPANYQTHTTVRDPNEVFAFSFPDIHGKIVSSDDPQFKGKVVLAIVTGTWCPNCHDEARYLVELWHEYHDKGVEIVALDFEEPDQQKTLKRVNAFIKEYKIPYPYLIAGAPGDMWDKVPQAVNMNTWPTTLFIGRDGRVKATHSGFAAPGSGVFNEQLKQEFTANIDRLLNEKPDSAAPANLSASISK